ncbi:MAG: DUF4405 domain-containing protein [Phycisphaerae bacterium]|nr:DUF4405 domain-containing protein [Phycisphaerae bacterium]
MKRNTLNFCVDFVTLIVFLGMVITGFLVRFLLPPGTGGRLSIWNWGRHDWGDLHFWLAVGLLGLILVHVILHWAWICQVARRSITGDQVAKRPLARQRRFWIGIATMVIMAAAILTFYWSAARSVQDERGRGIRGRITAADATIGESMDQDRKDADHTNPDWTRRHRNRGRSR